MSWLPLGRLLAPAPPVTAVAFAPDGKEVVVGSQAGLDVRTWPDLKPARSLKTELSHVHDVAFSPDGKTLAAVGGEPGKKGTVELFRWPSGELLHRFSPHRDLIYAAAWRTGTLATASADGLVGLHDANAGKPGRKLDGHSRAVLAVAFLPGDAGLLTAGADATLRTWDADGKPALTLSNHTLAVHDLAVRPGHDKVPLVVSVSDDRTVRFWQPTTGRMVRFARLASVPLVVAWLGDRAAVACKDGKVRLIDPDTAEVTTELPALDGVAYSLAVAPDGSLLVGGQGGQLRRLTVTPSAARPGSGPPRP